jgi:dihydroorotase
MNVLLKNVRMIQGVGVPERQDDLLIRAGKISAIGRSLEAPADVEIIDQPGLCVSPGWVDVGVQTGDPGFEHREDLFSCAAAAAAGGFTAVACLPNTCPAVHSKSEVLYIQNKTAHLPVRFYPIGAISVGSEGKDLAELYDMHAAGAVAFGDGNKSVQDAGLMLRALDYVRAFNGLIFNTPHHKTIAAGGQMHEGLVSTQLGLRGISALSETLMVQRDLSLLEYANSRLHIHLVSAAGSVALIRAAKRAGLSVTASVAVANLCFTDEQLSGFDSQWKLQPPLRSEEDRLALLEGLLDGTLDFICSHHTPWDEEAKNVEFPYAEFGMVGLETLFGLCRTHLAGVLPLPLLIEKIALAPRRVLGLPLPSFALDAPADLTVFSPDEVWTFSEQALRSKSKNTPLLGKTLRGRVQRIIASPTPAALRGNFGTPA